MPYNTATIASSGDRPDAPTSGWLLKACAPPRRYAAAMNAIRNQNGQSAASANGPPQQHDHVAEPMNRIAVQELESVIERSPTGPPVSGSQRKPFVKTRPIMNRTARADHAILHKPDRRRDPAPSRKSRITHDRFIANMSRMIVRGGRRRESCATPAERRDPFAAPDSRISGQFDLR